MIFRVARLLSPDNCPDFILNEAKISDRQSYFETLMFGHDADGNVTTEYKPLKSGKPSKVMKDVQRAVENCQALMDKHVETFNGQVRLSVDGIAMNFNLFPAVITRGDVKFVAGVNFELVSQVHRHVVTRWDDFYVHLDSAFFMALYILNTTGDIDASFKGDIHYVHWLIDPNGANLMVDVAVNDVRMYEGKETFRLAKELIHGGRRPNLFSCVKCRLECDQRLNIYRE